MDYVVTKFCSACLFVEMNRSDEMNVWMSSKDLELKKEVLKKEMLNVI